MANDDCPSPVLAPEYIRAAYLKAVFSALRRHVEQYLPTLGAPEIGERPRILAEDAPHGARFVPDDALEGVLVTLERLENEALADMHGYEMVKRQPAAPPAQTVTKRRKAPSAARPRRR